MPQKLPYKNCKWSNDLTLDKIQTGTYEVDILIPENLHNKFKDYPLASEIKSMPENNLNSNLTEGKSYFRPSLVVFKIP